MLEKANEYKLPADLCFGDWRTLDVDKIEKIIHWLWKGQISGRAQQLIKYVQNAKQQLAALMSR